MCLRLYCGSVRFAFKFLAYAALLIATITVTMRHYTTTVTIP